MKEPQKREPIKQALAAFQSEPFKAAATALLGTLGYRSDRVLSARDSSPAAFLALFNADRSDIAFDRAKALIEEWKTAELLFQLTDEELSQQASLFADTEVRPGLLRSYVFIAVELRGAAYARGKFAAITRQLNRLLPMPVMVLFKHQGKLTIAVINRRMNKRDEAKDVLGKVTLIREIDYANPHTGHLDILASLVLADLVHPDKLPITNFDTLHAAWEQIFNIDLLNERFYRELSDWYFWALPKVEFPADLEPDAEKRRATGLIRLLTRLIFCWFIKEKGLIPEQLFHPADLSTILKDFRPEAPDQSDYYHAILQNLFFATLNQRMDKDAKGEPYRRFAPDGNLFENRDTYDINNLFRYQKMFRDPATAITHFEDIPFLNGGLFECLDRTDEKTKKKLYLDGFSRTARNRPSIPNKLFFGPEEIVDLSDVFGDTKRKKEKVRGLIHILNGYKFTILENTPIDQEIALDPELLGKVFENLLASYNEETRTTARKQTGSFYTPRPIVDYMVTESLIACLATKLTERSPKPKDVETRLRQLFAYIDEPHQFTEAEVGHLVTAIDKLSVLDPACGSGAFPMGVLHKLVHILSKLDPGNIRWKETQLAKLDSPAMREKLERDFADNDDDYGRKLYLIENCIFGVDIQPIAIQISKLRFFVSLVAEQKTSRNKKENHGITPLPNLETKFVAADTLIRLADDSHDEFQEHQEEIERIEKCIEALYHQHFSIQRRDRKLALQKEIRKQRYDLANLLSGFFASSEKSRYYADWDPFDPESRAGFFDPRWMFGRALDGGFDIVIGNPPYLRIQGIQQVSPHAAAYYKKHYKAATGSFDLYVIFMERGMQLIRESGILNFINPDKWVHAAFGKGIRSYAVQHGYVHRLISFGAHQVFSASTYSSLLWMGKTKADSLLYAYLDPAASQTISLNEELGRLDGETFTAIPINSLSSEPWILAAGANSKIISALQTHQRSIDAVFGKIFQGIASSKDSVYFMSAAKKQGCNWTAYSAELGERVEIEAGLVRPLLMGDQVHRYEPIRTTNIVLFPYHYLFAESASPTLMAPAVIQKKFPLGWEYLQRCEAVLRGREGGRLSDDPAWYRYIYPKNLGLFQKVKLLAPDISLGGNFSIDRGGEFYTTTTLYGYIKYPEVWESYEFWLAVLNSRILWFYLKNSGSVLANGYFRYKPAYLQNFPVPTVGRVDEAVISTLVRILLVLKEHIASQASSSFLGMGGFLDDLIEACVMECYFRDHMTERDLLFIDTLAPSLEKYDPKATSQSQLAFAEHLYRTLNEPKHPIRNCLLRISADSPDLLAVIKAEGRT